MTTLAALWLVLCSTCSDPFMWPPTCTGTWYETESQETAASHARQAGCNKIYRIDSYERMKMNAVFSPYGVCQVNADCDFGKRCDMTRSLCEDRGDITLDFEAEDGQGILQLDQGESQDRAE